MRRLLIILLITCCAFKSEAQLFNKAFKADRLVYTHVYYDSQNYIYMTGYAAGHFINQDSITIYRVIKYSPSGQEIWRKEITSTDVRLSSAFSNDMLYLAGSYSNSIYTAQSTSVSAGGWDMCFFKFDANGNYQMRSEGVSGDEYISGLGVSNDSLYVAGIFRGTVSPGNFGSNTYSNSIAFLAKLDAISNWNWIKFGVSNNGAGIGSLKMSHGRLFSGFSGGNIIWDGTVSCGNYSAGEFDLSGNLQTVYPFIRQTPGGDVDLFNVVQENGHFIFMDCLDWHDTWHRQVVCQNSLQTVWTQTLYPRACDERSVFEKSGNLYWFSYPQNIVQASANTGAVEFVDSLNQPNISEGFFSDYSGNDLLFYGYFRDTITLGNDVLNGDSKGYAFIALINRSVMLGTKNYTAEFPVNIYPIPTGDYLHVSSPEKIQQLRIRNLMGNLILQSDKVQTLDLHSLLPGIYFLEVKNFRGQTYTRKILKE